MFRSIPATWQDGDFRRATRREQAKVNVSGSMPVSPSICLLSFPAKTRLISSTWELDNIPGQFETQFSMSLSFEGEQDEMEHLPHNAEQEAELRNQ